jgi:type II restriction/modification system DNA methylase subunit YeeA
MTPQQFIDKWRKVELKERTASQSHFIDLCHLLGLDDPVAADGTGEWFTFEKGASKSGGGEGWADVWRKDCFAWEYKGKRKDLDAAFEQLRRYAIGLENPPLLIVSDMDTIRVHTNWTNTVQQVHVIRLEDLTDAANRDKLKACFENPEILKPAKTRQKLTEEAAAQFAGIAERLRGRGHDGMAVAHFVQRLVFCMFAEDVNLLPNKMFQRMLEGCAAATENFELHAKTLFGAMRSGGMVGFEKVDWFNGGLFDDDAALPLNSDDLKDLLAATKLDWSDIDPSILGTLFERGLDPAKRSQLGAHYTDREKIMQIVNPVIIEPLMAEWAGVKAAAEAALDKARTAGAKATRTKAENDAQKLVSDFMEKLAVFRVLDPACGSGNFLYLSLLALKDIEHRAQLEAEAMGLPRGFPRTGPENVLGIELNPYAAELARASVWIGEIQWMRRNGFEASRNPVLRSLNNIECRDAVLNADGTRADWPKADVVVGNPPFLGNKKMIGELGEAYTARLRKAYGDVPGGVDLVCYWFAKSWDQMEEGRLARAGLVATNSIRGDTNRDVLKRIVEGGRIFNALSDEPWFDEKGAAVRVSIICFDVDGNGVVTLDGEEVPEIYSDLAKARGGVDLTSASTLFQNRGAAFQGPVKVGAFDVEGDLARVWLSAPINPNGRRNSDVVRPLLNGQDITRRPSGRWIVDFGIATEADASLYEGPFEHVRRFVKPVRDSNRRERRREFWWQHGETVPGLKRATQNLPRAIFTARVAKHRLFVWANAKVVPDSRVVAIARDDDTSFGILHSRFHEYWSLELGGWHGVGNDPQYTPSLGFETFPFPEGLTPNIPAADYAADPRAQKIAAAAARLNELRENWLNPADLVVRVPEVVPGYPDRILPKDEPSAALLKKRTLTNLYNDRPAWLMHAHAALDEAVAEAYGWGEDWRAGKLTEDDILARLFQLNQERAAKEAI